MTYRLLLWLVALLAVPASPAALANPLPFDPEELKVPAADPAEAPARAVLADVPPVVEVRDVAPPAATPALKMTLDVAPDVSGVDGSTRILGLAGGGVAAVLLGGWLLVRGRRREDEADA